METTILNVVNGVDINKLEGTIAAIQENPKVADFKFRANNKWLDGAHNRTTIKSFYGALQEDSSRTQEFILENDEPDVLLGTDRASNPAENLLHALAGCITTSLVYHAAAKGIHINGIESSYDGYLDLHGFLGLNLDTPRGFQSIDISFKIDGDLTQDQKEEVVKVGCHFSPVYSMVTKAVEKIVVTVS